MAVSPMPALEWVFGDSTFPQGPLALGNEEFVFFPIVDEGRDENIGVVPGIFYV